MTTVYMVSIRWGHSIISLIYTVKCVYHQDYVITAHTINQNATYVSMVTTQITKLYTTKSSLQH